MQPRFARSAAWDIGWKKRNRSEFIAVSSSISRQLIFWLAVPLLVMALCGALVHYFNNVAPGVLSSDRRLRDAANGIMAHVSVNDGVVLVQERAGLTPLPLSSEIIYAVRDPQGRLLTGDPRIPRIPMESDVSRLFSMTEIDHRVLRALTTRFDTRGGIVFISVVDARFTGDPAARYGFMGTLLWDFVQLDVTLVLVWIGIQLGLRPIRRLRDEIAQRSPQDLRPIAEGSAPREIAPVVVTLNRLFGALRVGAQSQQHFIANTAHQLRTPITGIQAQLDVLVAEAAAEPVRERLRTLQESIRQLAHTANQLLTLARADPSANVASKNQRVDLGELVGEVAARYFDRALQNNIDLGVDVQPASVIADPALLDDMLSNLVDNALKYTPRDGRVTVSTATLDGSPCLTVEDTGPGIPEGDRQRVRQRFYRIPNSPGHGSGLGLAIADEIARFYDAQLTIGGVANGAGTRIQVTFPGP
jgi:two-component system, OmpR family, sensor histidine kinase TctE